jgi:hypothetical protein
MVGVVNVEPVPKAEVLVASAYQLNVPKVDELLAVKVTVPPPQRVTGFGVMVGAAFKL